MPINSKIKQLYDALKERGGDVGSEQEFNDWFLASGDNGYQNRKYVYETMKEDGDDVGENYEEFRDWLGLHPVRQNTVKKNAGQNAQYSAKTEAVYNSPANTAPNFKDKAQIASELGKEGYDSTPLFDMQAEENRLTDEGLTVKAARNKKLLKGFRGYSDNSGVSPEEREAYRMVEEGEVAPFYATQEKKDALNYGKTSADWQRRMGQMKDRELIDTKRRNEVFGAIDRALSDNEARMDTTVRKEQSDENWLSLLGGRKEPSIMPYGGNVDLQNMYAERRQLQSAREIVETMEGAKDGFVGDAVKSFGQALTDMDTWDFGLGSLAEATRVRDVLDKADSGKDLTQSERNLLDAVVLNTAAQMYYGHKDSTGRIVGSTSAQMIPFMIEMAINPAAGLGKAASTATFKKLARWAAKSTLKRYVLRGAQGGARVLGDIGAGYIMAGTTGAAQTAADVTRRMTGNVEVDPVTFTYIGRKDMEDFGSAAGKALTGAAIERQSELLGEYFSPLLNAIGGRLLNGVVKGVEKSGNQTLRNFLAGSIKAVRGLNRSQVKKFFGKLNDYTHYDGTFGEYLEEVVGNIENAAFVGDMNFGTGENGVFNPEDNMTTFLAVAVPGVTQAVINTAVQTGMGAYSRAKVGKADAAGREVFGDVWDFIKDDVDRLKVEGSTPESLARAYGKLLRNYTENDDEVNAVRGYFTAAMMAKTLGFATNLRKDVKKDEVEDLYDAAVDEGADATPEEVHSQALSFIDLLDKVDEDKRNAIDDIVTSGVRDENSPQLADIIDGDDAALQYFRAVCHMAGQQRRIDEQVSDALSREEGRITPFITTSAAYPGENVLRPVRYVRDGEERSGYILGESEDGTTYTIADEEEPSNLFMLNASEVQDLPAVPVVDWLREHERSVREQLQSEVDNVRANHPNTLVMPAVGDEISTMQGRMRVASVLDDGRYVLEPSEMVMDEESGVLVPKHKEVYGEEDMFSLDDVVEMQNNYWDNEDGIGAIGTIGTIEGEEDTSGEGVTEAAEETAEGEEEAGYKLSNGRTLPVDDEGNPVFAGVEDELEDAVQYIDDVSEKHGDSIASKLLDNYIKEANDAVKQLQDKEPELKGININQFATEHGRWEEEMRQATAVRDFWQGVRNERQQKSLESAQDARAAAMLAAEKDTLDARDAALGEAQTLEEFVDRSAFNYKYLWDNKRNGTRGLAAHLFANASRMDLEEERRKRLAYLSNSEGVTPEEAAHKIAQYANESGLFGEVDDTDVLNMLIESLRRHNTRGEVVREYEELRMEAVRQAARAEEESRLRAEADAREDFAHEAGFDSYDEYASAVAAAEAELDVLSEEELNEIYNVIAEEYERENEGSGDVLPQAGADNPEGAGRVDAGAEAVEETGGESVGDMGESSGERNAEEWNGHQVGDVYQYADGKRARIIGFDYSHGDTPEVLVRWMDANGNDVSTEAIPPLVFELDFERVPLNTEQVAVSEETAETLPSGEQGGTASSANINASASSEEQETNQSENGTTDDYIQNEIDAISKHFAEDRVVKSALKENVDDSDLYDLLYNKLKEYISNNYADLNDPNKLSLVKEFFGVTTRSKQENIEHTNNFIQQVIDKIRKHAGEKATSEATQPKRLVSDERMEELKARLRKKLGGQMNMGVDPEILTLGAELAVAHIERGLTKFSAYAKAMIADLGDAIRPYLKAFYNAVRDMPGAESYVDMMDSYDSVRAFDVANFETGKPVDVFETARTVEKEKAVEKQAEEAKVKLSDEKPHSEGPVLRKATEADFEQEHPIVYYQGKPYNILAVTRSGEQVSATQFSAPRIDRIYLTNGKSVTLDELMVEAKPSEGVKSESDSKDKKSEKKVGAESKKNGKKVKPSSAMVGDLFGGEAAVKKEPVKPKLDKNDYRTYMTDEAKEYFEKDPRFAKSKHKELNYITAAVWDGVVIPVEELAKIPQLMDAQKRSNELSAQKPLQLSEKEIEQYAERLLDAEHGSAVFEDGKIRKVDGREDFGGAVKQERKAFIVIGRPAGGKSSVFANGLSNEHGARIVDSDVVKEWLDGFDGGFGAGYVQNMSAQIAERALDIAVRNGDNIVLPRIGGNSVMIMSAALRAMGYDVQLYFNDVVQSTSYMRSSSRFAMTGRYLSLDYLTSIKDKPNKTFIKFAQKSIGDYINECTEEEIQKLRGRLESMVGRQRGDLLRALYGWLDAARRRNADAGVQADVERPNIDGTSTRIDLNAPMFSYAEWKSNDVAFGEKPKEIWNSESGKELPQTSNTDNYGHARTDAARSEGLSTDSSNSGEYGLRANGKEAGQESKRTDGRGTQEGVGSVRQRLHDGLRPSDQLNTSSANNRRTQQPLERPAHPKNLRNNHAERGKNYAPKGVDARIEANIKAIELMKQLAESGEQATPEQMAVLRQFSGWGGLGKAFENFTAYTKGKPTPQYLRELLGEEAYQQANMSRNSAYYTPANVIDALWNIARAMGFQGGRVLEGSAGIGDIIGHMPTDMSERSDIHAVEIDQTTGNILSLLYPDAQVDVQGFEATQVENGSVDLAITNVPFVPGMLVPKDTSGDSDLSRKFRNSIQDFCIAKNVRKLREGGIGIFITSRSTLDDSARLREWIEQEGGADVVGAFRLNNETFGGTGATSDIIVIRKRVNGKKSAHAIDVLQTTGVRTAEYETEETKRVKGEVVPVVKLLSMDYNKYFVEHPEMMAGEMHFGFEKGNTLRPTSKALYPSEGKNQDEMLKAWAESFAEKEWETDVAQKETLSSESADVYEDLGEGVKEGSLVVSDGQICVAQRGKAVPLGLNANKVKGKTKIQCFEAYQSIKKALADLLEYQTSVSDNAGLQPLLKALNKAYDNFVKTYGYLHKNTAISFLKNDVDFSNILALESFKEIGDGKGGVTREYGKTDVFSKRVVEKEKAPEPKDVKDGIIASIYVHGRIDLPWMAEKLGGKTEQEIKDEIIASGLGFENPMTRQMEVSYEYLSGNVREKLAQARANNSNGQYDANIKALEAVVPMNIPAHLIEFSLGSSWIDPKLYEEYVKEKTDIDVQFTPAGGTWYMKAPSYVGEQKNRAMGVVSEMLHKTIMGTQLIEAAIQNKTITVSETRKKWDGTTETITDKEATQACSNKIDEIRQDFKEWARAKMQSDAAMSENIERIYNDMFNNYVPKSIPDEFVPAHFGGAAMTVGGKAFSLRPHQAKAAIRGTTQPLLLAHEVGSGKTYTLITTAMEMRRLGTARKPMIVVQNATVGQFVESAKELYPNAKVLTIEDADRTVEGRKNFYSKIKYNDWDMIVVPQSVFERIPDSEERQMKFVQDKIEEKLLVLEQMKDSDPQGQSVIVRQAEKEIASLQEELAGLTDVISTKRKERDEKKAAVTRQNAEVKALEMLDRQTDDVENFDDMGIDALLVDEAHEYKHLGFATAMQRGVKGVDPSYSKKAQGVYLKTQAVMEKNNGRNVVFATGTPISNTAAEIWTFMRYLMPADTMKEYGIYYFDDFVRNFGNLTQMLEFTTSGKFKENNRFAGYVNLPELVRIWSGIADTVLNKDIEAQRIAEGKESKIPDMEGGKAEDIYLPQTRSLRSVMKFVKKTLEEYDKMSGKEKRENSHIPLTMYGIAKAAAVDARLVVSDAPDEPQSKTNEAVRQTLRSLRETSSYKGTVAIFADNYQNKRSGFNLYEDIRSKLIAEGVPAEQIVVMKSGMSIKKKLEIFDKVNRGEVRVIMGSTFTLGTGVNIQERLHTLIHVDAPNRPMDYTQRNGRILRQGNLHKEMGKSVRVLRFGVEDSLDVTAYQRLKTKGAIADSIMNGKTMLENAMENRALEEEEDVFGDTVAQLSGSEYAMLKNQAEKDVRKYEAKKKQYEADQTYCHNEIPRLEGEIRAIKEQIDRNRQALSLTESMPSEKIISVGGQRFATVEAMGDYIKDFNKKVKEIENSLRENPSIQSQHRELTVNVGGVDFVVSTDISIETVQNQGTLFSAVRRKMTYSCERLGLKDVPVHQSLLREALEDITQNVVTGNDFRERIERGERQLEKSENALAQIRERYGKPFAFTKELEAAHAHLDEYSELMKKELEEKDKKYSEIDAEVAAAEDVTNAEEADESDAETDDGIRFRDEEEESPVFFSNAARAVEGIRQEKATPEQWLAMITKAGGLKAGEDKWLGLSDWLKGQDKKSLTKQEVLEYIRENEIQVEDVEYGDNDATFTPASKRNLEHELEVGGYSPYNVDRTEQILAKWDKVFDDHKLYEWQNGYFDIDDNGKIIITGKGTMRNPINETRLFYTTDGLENNREIALVVPTIESWNNSDEIHFGDAGGGRAVAWVRFGQTTDADGNRVLVIDEIQSKRHQEGREKGYQKEPPADAPEVVAYKKADKEVDDYLAQLRSKYKRDDVSYGLTEEENARLSELHENEFNTRVAYNKYLQENHYGAFSDSDVPDAPFDKNWHELAMKRMLRYAAENGYDKVAWTKGEQQAERYNIGNVVSSINVTPYKAQSPSESNGHDLVMTLNDGTMHEMFVQPDGTLNADSEMFNGKKVSEVFGKGIAERIMSAGEPTEISGNGLRIGGEGMKGFYDQILPRFMDKYGKKWGVKTGEVQLPNVGDQTYRLNSEGKMQKGLSMWSVDVTPEMRESVMEGQPLFREDSVKKGIKGERSREAGVYEGRVKTGKTRRYTLAEQEAYAERQLRQMRKSAASLAEKMGIRGRVLILDSDEGLAARYKGKRGWYDASSGRITVVLGNHSGKSDVIETILHEAVAHHGLRELFGDRFDTFLDNVYEAGEDVIRNAIDASAQKMKRKDRGRHSDDYYRRVATEEYLAHLAERIDYEAVDNVLVGWWTRVKAAFLRMLGQLGVEGFGQYMDRLSDNELRYVLWRSYQNLAYPGRYRNPFLRARDVEMQRRMSVGEYKERARLLNTGRIPLEGLMAADNAVAEEEIDDKKNDGGGEKVVELFRDEPVEETLDMKKEWDKLASSFAFQLRETAVDYLTAVKKMQELIEKKLGQKIKDFENAHAALQQVPRQNKVEMDNFNSFVVPQLKEAMVKLLGKWDGKAKWDEGEFLKLHTYTYAKHGIERNRQMAVEAAVNEYENDDEKVRLLEDWEREKAAVLSNGGTWAEQQRQLDDLALTFGADLKKDYSGLTSLFEKEAEDTGESFTEIAYQYVEDYEASKPQEDVNAYWKAIEAVTDYALQKQYGSGLVNKEYVEAQKRRFQYYVPLRGFKQTVAEDVYDYMNNDARVSTGSPVKSAGGRTSEADNIFGALMEINYQSITAGNKNLAKQAVYFLAKNHNTDGLLSVAKVYLVRFDEAVNNDAFVTPQLAPGEEKPKWVEAIPNIPAHADAEMVQDVMEQFNREIQRLQEESKGKKNEDKSVLSQWHRSKIRYRTLFNDANAHQIRLKMNGEDIFVTVNADPRFAQAVNGLTNPNVGDDEQTLLGFLDKIRRMQSAFFTSLNAAFSIGNLARDSEFSSMNVAIKEDAQYWANFVKNRKLVAGGFAEMLYMLYRYRNGKLNQDGLTGEAKMFKEFLDKGGATGFTVVDSQKEYAETFAKDIYKLLQYNNRKTGKVYHYLTFLPKALFNGISFISEASELVNRYACYKTSREAGRSVRRSIQDASEVSLNFGQKGAGYKTKAKGSGLSKTAITTLAALCGYGRRNIIFFNAAMQGKYIMFENMKNHPVKALAFNVGAPLMLASAAIPLLNTWALPFLYAMIKGDDDDDDEKSFKERMDEYSNRYFNYLSSFERRNNICILLPNGGFATIPLDQEVSPVWAMGDIVAGKSFANIDIKSSDVIGSVLDLVSPVDVNVDVPSDKLFYSIASAVSPSAVSGPLDLMANTDFRGKRIYKEEPYTKGKPQYQMVYNNGKSISLVRLSKLSNEIGGGDASKGAGFDERSGSTSLLDWNPDKLYHLIQSYSGGVGTTILSMPDFLVNWSEGKNVGVSLERMPLVQRFYKGGSEEEVERRITRKYNEEVEYLIKNTKSLYKRYEKSWKESANDPIQHAKDSAALFGYMNSENYKVANDSLIVGANEAVKEYDKAVKAGIDSLNAIKLETMARAIQMADSIREALRSKDK